jgi:hypothetical protein
MVRKKLLTLAGVVGILACGACFLPPLPQKKVPLPPALSFVHKVAIQVEDATHSNLFDSRRMSESTAFNFNQYWTKLPVKALNFYAGVSGDAILKITVISKTVSCPNKRNEMQFCTFEMSSSYALTAADGRILQSRPQESAHFREWLNGADLPENLNDDRYRWDASYPLAVTAGQLFLSSPN